MAQKTLVLDASVIVKWYFKEEGSTHAQEIYDAFKNNKVNIVVPVLLYYEVANAVKYTKTDSKEKVDIIKSLFGLRLDTVEPSEDTFLAALESAEIYDATMYDCVYLAVAKKLGCKYITADAEFCKKAKREAVPLEHWDDAL